MVRFVKGLNTSIVVKVDIQPYWSFEDVCKLAIKVEKYSKGKKMCTSSYTKPTAPPKPHTTPKPNFTSKVKGKWDEGKAIVKGFPKQLDGMRCFKCQGYDDF